MGRVSRRAPFADPASDQLLRLDLPELLRLDPFEDLRDVVEDRFVPLLRAAAFFAPLFVERLLDPVRDLLAALRFEPEPPRLPPPSCLLTVAQARRSASSSDT